MSIISPSDIFLHDGTPRDVAGNQPLWLSRPETVWWIDQGQVDVFLVPVQDGAAAGARTHLFRRGPGEILCSFPPGVAGVRPGFLAVGSPATRIYELPISRLKELRPEGLLAEGVSQAIDRWIETLCRGFSPDRLPAEVVKLGPDEEIELSGSEAAQPSTGVLWAKHVQGESRLAGLEEFAVNRASGLVPLASGLWLESAGSSQLVTYATSTLVQEGSIWSAFPPFHDCIARWAQRRLHGETVRQELRCQAKAGLQRTTLLNAMAALAEPLAPPGPGAVPGAPAQDDPLWGAFRCVAQALGIPVQPPAGLLKSRAVKDPLERVARAARVRLRRVMLRHEWWLQDNGPMLAFTEEGRQPVAVLPVSATRYVMVDPVRQTQQPLTAALAQSLHPTAYTLQRPFPDASLKVMEVLRFGLHNARPDLVMVVTMSLAGGLLGTALPLAVGLIFDSVIPNSARPQLWFIVVGLFVAGCTAALFEVTRGIALLRVEARSDTTIQAAVWDRLLSLPLPFFRQFTAGDLTLRANGINAIRQILSGAVITAVLSGVFSLFNFALLFYFSVNLALVATVLLILNLGVTLLVSLVTLRLQRPLYALEGKISGLVLQLITGIAKLRVAGAELQAYGVWAKAFARKKKTDLELTTLGNRFIVFNEAYPLLTSICLFAVIAFWDQPGLSTGRFLAFTAAFMTFLYAALEAGDALMSLLETVPIYERAQPILQALPEVTAVKSDPGDLTGRVELSQVSFRYKADGPLVLQEVSLRVDPGEFVAIVGPSGSGKSTLLRLLLGFEQPETGTIRYDGADLAGLDVQAVRRQCGVVLQHGKLMPGDIYENIVGSALFTLDEAWEAARKAGLAEDVEAMPMGMHTVLGEGGGTLSGGQRQRLMIARAIVGRPRLILFDEATSALDNRTQTVVNQSLEQLQATRIVIAHRLSTIMNAHRLYVLEKGRIVQTGSSQALLEQAGPFAELARRQLA